MVLYLSIVFGAMSLISVLNIFLNSFAFDNYAIWVICAVVLSTVVEIAIQGVIATVVKHMPNKWFTHDKKLFKISKKERGFYEKIKIRSWKDKVWELGALGGFRKNKIADPNNSEYLLQFVVESNKGIVDHVVGIFMGFLVIFILPLKYALVIGVPVACVNLILCILPTMILRYNIPKIMVAYERARRTAALAEKQAAKEKIESKEEKIEEPKAEVKEEPKTESEEISEEAKEINKTEK